MKSYKDAYKVLSVRALSIAVTAASPSLYSGAFITGGDSLGIDSVTHAYGYTGGANQNLTVKVCIVPGSPNSSVMEIPVKNTINTINAQQSASPNLLFGTDNNLPFSNFDFESVALHEMGHCMGLAHTNRGGGSSQSTRYTNSTRGVNGAFDDSPGNDGVIGSSDDIRGDDTNLHWFDIASNNPFTEVAISDGSTMSVDLTDLPSGDSFAASAGRDVGTLLGVIDTESVMQQLTINDEAQRSLAADDVNTLSLAQSGVDMTAGTSDDYTYSLTYGGISSATDCDINISFNNAQTGFAVCAVGFTSINGGINQHWRLTSGEIYMNTSLDWFFNQTSNATSSTCNGQAVTVDLNNGQIPTAGDDVILGTPGSDTINAFAGNDTICGEGGDDTINGGGGDDVIFGGDGNDVLSGQGGDDTLYGDTSNDVLNGGTGMDTLFGGSGDDDLRGQSGADTLWGEDGVDQFFGGSGNDTIHTGPGGNLGTAQVVRGNGNNDTIFGSDSNDLLEGGPGLDEIHGDAGNDILRGGGATDNLFGDEGDDLLEGNAQRDFLYGGDNNDTLAGGSGNDDLFGEAGDDSLNGQGGTNDVCDGGAGLNDTSTTTCESLFNVP